MARGTAVKIVLSAEELGELETLVRRRKSSHGAATRARIVLLAAEGLNNSTIAKKLDVSRLTVGTWRRRFAKKRRDGLDDEPRPGAPRKIGDDKITEVVTKTQTMPQDATHWSRRSMARSSGVSVTSVHRIWGAFGLQPHRVETFKLSTDPMFVEKVRDIVGLYLDPPDRALDDSARPADAIVLGGLAEFERELIRARTGEGRKRAKERGVRFGRPRKMTPHQRLKQCSASPLARRKLMSLAPTMLMPPRSAGCWVIALSLAAQTWSPINEAARPVTQCVLF